MRKSARGPRSARMRAGRQSATSARVSLMSAKGLGLPPRRLWVTEPPQKILARSQEEWLTIQAGA